MDIDQNKIKEILLKENYINKANAEKADEYVKNKEGEFLDYFMSNGLLTKDLFGQALAESFNVPYLDLNTNVPEKNLILKIPEEMAIKFRAILFKETEKTVIIATDNPSAQGIKEEIKKVIPDKEISVGFSLSEDIDSLFPLYKKTLDTRFNKIIEESEKIAPEIIDEIIDDALGFKASDVHFDLQDSEVIIRFRIDGLLHEAGRIPITYYANILNRVKVQAGMKIDEHFSAQDGAIRFDKNGQSVDMRVSVVPTLEGEKIVIRIFAEYMKNLTLDDLGLSKYHQKLILRAAQRPFGMVLVTGPTGSGKTTTLYALLKDLNTPEKNIATIEDPVEYKIPGVNHIQVNSATNLTFADGLKSLVRQDPDVILVGEIRDKETAAISINAALSGHLLFSTFHANDAASVIPRFLEMGIEPLYLSLTLKLVVAQRLVRKICNKCKYSYKISIKELSDIFPEAHNFFGKETTLYKGKGCPSCSGSGYRGRTAIFEMVEVDSEMEKLMLTNPSAQQIWLAEKKRGIQPIFNDGLEKVKDGTTTIEELLRVADPPEEPKGNAQESPKIVTVAEEKLEAPKKKNNKK
jgi:type II secretory ATPase GspE/PulE/Tfp pilus assembly ATPase PilB-like protein